MGKSSLEKLLELRISTFAMNYHKFPHLWANTHVTLIKGFTHIQTCLQWNAVAIKEFPRTWNYRFLMPNGPSDPKGLGHPYKFMLVSKSS